MSGRTKEGLDNERKQKRKTAHEEETMKTPNRKYKRSGRRSGFRRGTKRNKKQSKSNKTTRKNFFAKVLLYTQKNN